MKDLNEYYVTKLKDKNDEWQYLHTLYDDSHLRTSTIDEAIKFPEGETPKLIGEYCVWRKYAQEYKVICVKTVMEEVDYD